MTDVQHIRRRRDGSIDSGYYLARALDQRGAAAHQIAGRGTEKSRKALTALTGFVAALRIPRPQARRPTGH